MSDNNLSPVGKNKPAVKLVGNDGNAFAVLGRCEAALRKSGYTTDEIAQFQSAATSGDYNNLLATCCNWCDVS